MPSPSESGSTAGEPTPGDDSEIVREISHDEFNPTGTLALVGIYFVILVVMWVFMYFVEFAGHGPSIIQ